MSAQRSSIAVGVRVVSLTRQKTQLLAQCWCKLLQFWLNVACCTKVSSLAQIVQKSQSVLAYVLPTSDPNCGQVPRSIRLSFRGCARVILPFFNSWSPLYQSHTPNGSKATLLPSPESPGRSHPAPPFRTFPPIRRGELSSSTGRNSCTLERKLRVRWKKNKPVADDA